MPLKLYNTFSKGEEEFVPLEKGKVRMYTCGPTVYGRPHIGNYSSFLMADLLRRWLEVSGYEVTHVKNITDVGHLLHDADQGDDKIQREAEKSKGGGGAARVTWEDVMAVVEKHTNEFLEDEKALNILDPWKRPRASEFVAEQLAMIKTMLQSGHAYETDDGIYFSVQSFPQYGALSGNTIDKLSAGARIAVDERKKHPADFALWKKCVGDNARHVLRWTFATGKRSDTVGEDEESGFPGWHIECSAMSSSLLGGQIDIHTGGEDNIFPHHECEIAQSECSGPAPFVKYWVHKRRIDMGKEKMSKSLGNVLSVPGIQAMGYSKDSLTVLIVQLCTLRRGTETIPMSTREGEFVTLRQVMEEVGRDAARFFFLMRKLDSHLDFDLELAKTQAPENPVYYIQYAHARIAGILAKAEPGGMTAPGTEQPQRPRC